VADRAHAYGIPGETVDGSDVLAVYEVVGRAAERARMGDGPSLIEARTYRWAGHFQGDPEGYRSREEVDTMRCAHDPIKIFGGVLEARGVLTSRQAETIDAQVQREVEAAVEFAESSPEPSPSLLFEDLFA
jgi:TPP-dependent pyruvate/acetoin dehydrogenase alpha subunit